MFRRGLRCFMGAVRLNHRQCCNRALWIEMDNATALASGLLAETRRAVRVSGLHLTIEFQPFVNFLPKRFIARIGL